MRAVSICVNPDARSRFADRRFTIPRHREEHAAVKFCSNCASPVAKRVPPGDSLPRWVCDQCGEIHYQNPKLVVGTITEQDGRVLLCRRAIEPRYGYWTLPAGYMENDESTGQAAARETREEAGAKIMTDTCSAMARASRVRRLALRRRR